MPVDNNINDTTINMTASIPTRKADMQKKDVLATDDGSCTHSSGSTSEDEEDPDYEGVSTHKVSEVSTGALCLSGSPSNFHMENNSDVQIGPRLHYNAPVTINQFVHVLGSNEVSPDGILQEAVRAPIHGLDSEESNISQATLIGSIQNPHGESHHHTTAATKYNKVACLCLHWRIFLATLAAIVLLVIILTAIIIHLSSSSRDDLPKQTFYPAPEEQQ